MQLDERMRQFLDSLSSEQPPPGVDGPLLGCWHALRGCWGAAHDAVQGESDGDAWVHAALHREEGDDANARYWYGRAGRSAAQGAARREYLTIAAALLA
jgi:hypothetical protein